MQIPGQSLEFEYIGTETKEFFVELANRSLVSRF